MIGSSAGFEDSARPTTDRFVGRAESSKPALHYGWRSFLLGVFVLFQLVYFPAANFIKLIPLRLPESNGELDDDIQFRGQVYSEPVQRIYDAAGTAFVRWGELTGQAQGWALFAPTFGHQAALPVVSFSPVGGETPYPKTDIYFRVPKSDCRLFNYEYRLALLYWRFDAKAVAKDREVWRQAAYLRVRRQNKSMLAFMRWHRDRIVTALPTFAAPNWVQLWAVLLSGPPLSDPTLFNHAVRTFPIASWKPNEPIPTGMLPVQAQDPFTRELIWLPVEGEP